MSQAMTGYQYRRKNEEYHRQIKTDYCLEEMVYLRYRKLRNRATFFFSDGFIASLSKTVTGEFCLSSKMLPTGRLQDYRLISFIGSVKPHVYCRLMFLLVMYLPTPFPAFLS